MRPVHLRGTAAVGLVFLLAAIAIVLVVPSANQYEFSLYDAYPVYFWWLIVGALFTGALVIAGSALLPADRSWVFGVVLILMTNVLLFLLPSIRGYYMYGRSDPLSHIGFVEDIVIRGELGGNIYPPMHLLNLALAEATGTEPMTIALAVPVVFSVLYFGGMIYLLRSLFDSRRHYLLGLVFAMLPVLGRTYIGLRPFDVSVLFIPFVFYLFVRSQRAPVPRIRAIFVLSLVAVLLYHPLTALFLIVVFALWVVGKHAPSIEIQYATPTNFVSLSLAIFLIWYSNFTGIIRRFESVYETLTGQSEGGAPVDVYRQASEEASPALADVLRIVVVTYGIELILFTLGFLFAGVALFLFYRGAYVPNQYVVMFAGTLMLFSVGGFFFLVSDLQVPHSRPFQFAMIGAVLVIGHLFYLLLYRVDQVRNRANLHAGVYTVMIGVVFVLIVLSVFSLYPSPFGASSNSQVTEMETEGSSWILEHGHASDEFLQFDIDLRRFYHAEYGTSTERLFSVNSPPAHFNYTEHDQFGSSRSVDTYLLISEKGRLVYPTVFTDYPENWHYTPDDFDRLERDRTVERLYDNGAYNQYLINAAE